MRKEILERIFYLNNRTFAVKNEPHRMDVPEFEKKEKRIRLQLLLFIILLGICFLTVISSLAFPGTALETYLEEHKSFWMFFLVILVIKVQNLLVKRTLLSEQKFLVKLLNSTVA